jgi:hypothetical protein
MVAPLELNALGKMVCVPLVKEVAAEVTMFPK